MISGCWHRCCFDDDVLNTGEITDRRDKVSEEMDGDGFVSCTIDCIDTVADDGDGGGEAVVVLKRLMSGNSGTGRSNEQ
jgi:hypothetical protein